MGDPSRKEATIDWRTHAPVGITVTLLTLAIGAGFLWFWSLILPGG
ncbi:MAG: hypothetical protein RRA35_07735 [Desulfomonilia bacterium]|nr:hypothetical protein [Desulfomonilia bacterium]